MVLSSSFGAISNFFREITFQQAAFNFSLPLSD
jgi:hypothetical protein